MAAQGFAETKGQEEFSCKGGNRPDEEEFPQESELSMLQKSNDCLALAA